MHDLTPYLDDYIAHWQAVGVGFDAFYSGFLGSMDQIRIVQEAVARFSPGLVVIDPVMGDNGVIYKTYTAGMCEGMKALAGIADVLTPNLTEACRLADKPYDPSRVSAADIEALATDIRALGAKRIVITGIEREGRLFNCLLDENGYSERAVELLPFRMHGRAFAVQDARHRRPFLQRADRRPCNRARAVPKRGQRRRFRAHDHAKKPRGPGCGPPRRVL